MISPEQDVPTDFAPDNFLSSFFHTVKAVLFVPGLFYERMKTDAGLRNLFIFFISCVLIHTLIVGLFGRNQAIITVIIYIFALGPIMTQVLGSQWLTAAP